MHFFIMWLCFYTYCILALYAGARHDRRSENSLSHRQIQQLRIEYLQTIRKQQFGIRTYWIYEPNTSALTTVRFGAPSIIFSVLPQIVSCLLWNPTSVRTNKLVKFKILNKILKNYPLCGLEHPPSSLCRLTPCARAPTGCRPQLQFELVHRQN